MGYWESFMWIPLGLFTITFILAFILDFGRIKSFFGLKTTQNGMSLGLFLCICLAIFMAANYMVKKYNTVWDWTEEKIHQLSPQSLKIIKGLQKELKIYAFYNQSTDENKTRLQWLVNKYRQQSKKLSVEFYDMDLRPDLVQKYRVKSSGTLIFNYDGRQTRLEENKSFQAGTSLPIDEQELTNAMIKAMNTKLKVIYFLVGHNEKQLSNTQATGISELKQELEARSYIVRELRLISMGEVPKDADAVAVIGPEKKVSLSEITEIKKYLARGGNLLIAADPGMQHNLANLTKLVGVRFLNRFVVDFEGQMLSKNAAISVGTSYSKSHPITKDFDPNAYTFFPVSSNLELVEDINPRWKVDEILMSGERSFTQPKITEQPRFNKKRDFKGPLNLFYSIAGDFLSLENENIKAENFKALVVGDSDFLINEFIKQQGFNRDLILNSFSYLLDDLEIISISPKRRKGFVLYLSDVKLNLQVIFFFSVSIVCFAIAIILWLRRRTS